LTDATGTLPRPATCGGRYRSGPPAGPGRGLRRRGSPV